MEKGWIETYTGKKVFPLEPSRSQFCIEDIAHSLALTCRYNGHCAEFYSVAQHCCIVHDVCPVGLRAAGLLHDAAEAYLGDVVSPVKPVSRFVDGLGYRSFDSAEGELLWWIHQCLPISFIGYIPQVKPYDTAVMLYEKEWLMLEAHKWPVRETALYRKLFGQSDPLVPWTWKRAEKEFLKRYDGIVNE